jgi:hypothetical protein
MYAIAFCSPGVPGARPSVESSERSLMCCRRLSAVIACIAVSAAAVDVDADPLALDV